MIVKAIDRQGEFFVMADNIGWSEGNEDDGFNRESTNYVDGAGVPYPKLNERVLLVYAYLNRADTIQGTSVDGSIFRNSSDVEDYSEVAYSFNVNLSADGWYTVHTYLLPIDTYEGFYYDTAKELVVDALTGNEYKVSDLPGVEGITSDVYQYFFTPNTERMLNDKIAELTDLGMKEGKCAKDYKDILYANQFVDTQLSGAHVKFNDSYRYQASEILEDLNASNPYEFC